LADSMDKDVVDNLIQLSESSGNGLFSQLVDLFNSETPQRIAEIKDSVSNNNFELLNRAAHSLKSGAAYLGAQTLSEISKDIELQAYDKIMSPDIEDKIKKLETYFKIASEYLSSKE